MRSLFSFFTQQRQHTPQVMLTVSLAALPGLIALCWIYGPGSLIQTFIAAATALLAEATIMKLRHRPVARSLLDGSAFLTALLIAVALPPYAPWWIAVIAALSAMVLGKHLYGGLGQNPFNPAMVGYVVVLISFPLAMTQWPVPHGVSFVDALSQIFGFAHLPDGWSQATALDLVKNNRSLTLEELWQVPAFGHIGGIGSEVVNLAFLAGGFFLLHKRLISWQAPIGMLLGLGIMALLFWNSGSSDTHGSPLFHWLTGATMLGAFFIVTDPVTGATSPKGRFIFGLGVGALVYIIRVWGGYPDGVAFAVLLMNLCAPTIDFYSRPRTFGHSKARQGHKGSQHD